jgi:hypothetical protein
MGSKHKVRNFFNNIFNPHSPDGDVTIDTHAVAAGLLRPLSGASFEVNHSLDSSNSAMKGLPRTGKSSSTGVGGTYALYAEAYRRAAKKRKLLPREMQSITWEAVRGMYNMNVKGHSHEAMAKREVIDETWNRYREGMLDIKQVREKLLKITGGIKAPSWHTGEYDDESEADGEESDTGINEGTGDSSDTGRFHSHQLAGKTTTGMGLGPRIGVAGTSSPTAQTRWNLIKRL